MKILEKLKRAFLWLAILCCLLCSSSCGTVLEYRTKNGILIQEKIDGKLNPTISTDTLLLNDYFKR